MASGRLSAAPPAPRFVAGSRAVPLEEAARRLGGSFDPRTRAAARRLPLRFPEDYVALAVSGDPGDPLRRIGWPDPEELAPDPDAIEDPVGEQGRKTGTIVLRKYPDRALLLVTSRCHFYCRFCFRAGHGENPGLGEIEDAVARLAGERGLREVILSGGDPLTLPDEFLGAVLRTLAALPDLETVRIHTRAPVHDPRRVTPALVRSIVEAAPRPVRIAVHTSHPRELSDGFGRSTALFLDAGIPLLDQTVLLAGVNDDPETLATLMNGLAARRVRPYYLHHPDRVAGTARFRVPIPRGLAIYRALRARVAPEALPAYVLDLPDGSGKVPVESLVQAGARTWHATLPDGRTSQYVDIA